MIKSKLPIRVCRHCGLKLDLVIKKGITKKCVDGKIHHFVYTYPRIK